MAHLPSDTRLWVAGEGAETPELQARHAGDSRIEWLGTISETEKIARLAGPMCFVRRRWGGIVRDRSPRGDGGWYRSGCG